ncbi:DUF6922 domain-containing protein [Mucilaginibacter sp. OK098]|uniref:DUF6922 domain-containing protein n=1 Tax=Mucilaginibacter sp. OK098 TaxID=1855297 RepID=UPI000921BBB6|nr:hypothetical protein [Mucilaginibacter sp. OK098]SHN00776.1 hypothetical protein SAMN05216524_104535 [Mucilaginibacter sp. OK098]
MKRRQHISDVFPKHLFWDMDYSALDFQKDRDIIIPRALIASTPTTFQSDISKLESFYNSEQMVNELKATKERVSNSICSLVAERYHIESFSRFSK